MAACRGASSITSSTKTLLSSGEWPMTRRVRSPLLNRVAKEAKMDSATLSCVRSTVASTCRGVSNIKVILSPSCGRRMAML